MPPFLSDIQTLNPKYLNSDYIYFALVFIRTSVSQLLLVEIMTIKTLPFFRPLNYLLYKQSD